MLHDQESVSFMSKRPAISEEFLWAIFYGEGKWYPAILGAQLGEEEFEVKFVGYEEHGWQDTADQDIQYRIPLTRTSVLYDNFQINNKMKDCNNDEDRSDSSADSEQRAAKKPKGTFKQDNAAGVSKSTYLVGAAVGAAKVVAAASAAAGAAAGKFLGISATAGGAGEGEAGEPCEADVSRAYNTKVEQESRVIVKQRDQERHQMEDKLIKTEEVNWKLTQGIRQIEEQGQQELRKMKDTLKQRDQELHQMKDKLIKTEEHNRKLTQGIREIEKQGQQELRKMKDTLAKAEQEIQKMHIMHKQNAALQENNADALKKIHELTEQINVFRAMSSSATPGNNHINKEFPSNSEMVASYSRFVTNIFVELLDNETDILWFCAASKIIFWKCQNLAFSRTQGPQRTFQAAVMAGEGKNIVSEWESTKVFMTKLQRATRKLVIECHMGEIEEFVEKERKSGTGVLFKLLSQANYKDGSLESCIFKLLGVRSF